MKRVAITLVFTVALSSCSFVFMKKAPPRDPGTRPVVCSQSNAFSYVDSIGAGVSVIIAALFLGRGFGPGGADMEERILLVPLGIGAAATTVAYGWSAISANRSAERCRAFNAPPPVVEVPATNQVRDEAWEITKGAAAAARNGDCAEVIAAGEKVRALDSEFYEVVFLGDAAIAKCPRP